MNNSKSAANSSYKASGSDPLKNSVRDKYKAKGISQECKINQAPMSQATTGGVPKLFP